MCICIFFPNDEVRVVVVRLPASVQTSIPSSGQTCQRSVISCPLFHTSEGALSGCGLPQTKGSEAIKP